MPRSSDGLVLVMKAGIKAYTLVREGILAGRYPPGTRITEQEIVTLSGVSRTPVREALRKLAADGLVQIVPNIGVVVCEFSEQESDDIFGLRMVLEAYCARLAAERIDAASLEELRALATQMHTEVHSKKPDLDVVSQLNTQFHKRLYEASGNARLITILTSLIEPTLVLRAFQFYSPEALQRSASEHLELVEMLATGYADGAEALMRSHVLAARLVVQKQQH